MTDLELCEQCSEPVTAAETLWCGISRARTRVKNCTLSYTHSTPKRGEKWWWEQDSNL